MIFDVVKQSLKSPRRLIAPRDLLANAAGSRLPEVQPARLSATIAEKLVQACPTSALAISDSASRLVFSLDYGECTGCGLCYEPGEGALLPARSLPCCGARRSGLLRRWDLSTGQEIAAGEEGLDRTAAEIRAIVGHALNIRQLDAGSCNGCEAEIAALTNPYYDLERWGIHFTASPKHADMLLVTGPVTRNMAEAVKRAYEATPSPKLVVAVGTCGVSGGIFSGSYAVTGGVDSVIPVDGYIPGCPPTPAMLLTGILRVLRGSMDRV